MRKTTMLVLMGVVLLVAGGAALAAEEADKPQTTCPVTGKPVDKAVHLDYQGQRIYFCSQSCIAEFKQEPEKYFDRIAAEGVALENVQTTCPVTGEKLGAGDMGDPVSTRYKGRTVRFCCKMCVAKFEQDPAKYLAKLPNEQPAKAAEPPAKAK